MVVCCLCGIVIEPNRSNMCVGCLKAQVDITKDISTNETIHYCKACGRYSHDEKKYIVAELESPELLALCLKSIHGLGKTKGKAARSELVDAMWKWTEPHSKRLQIKLIVQQELPEFNSIILKQDLIVEFVVKNKMCKDCAKETTNQMWTTRVQLRQKVSHKRTLLALEQKIRASPVVKTALDIVQAKNGLDFYFKEKADANKFCEVVLQLVPSRRKKESKTLKGSDVHNNTYRFEYSIVLEVSHICKFDLIVLPPKLNGSLFNSKPTVVLCEQVTKSLHLFNPTSLKTGIVADHNIFEIEPLLTARDLVKFVVLDVMIERETSSSTNSKHKLAEIEVAREADFGVNNERFFVTSHLGGYVEAGDIVMGFDLTNQNFTTRHLMNLKGKELPNVVLVKKGS